MRIRSDCGTENTCIAKCQMTFRHDGTDQYAGPNSFVFGTSVLNTVCCNIVAVIMICKYDLNLLYVLYSALKAGGQG